MRACVCVCVTVCAFLIYFFGEAATISFASFSRLCWCSFILIFILLISFLFFFPIIWAICSSFTKFLRLTLCSLKFQPSFISKLNVISGLQLLSAEVKFNSYISSFSWRHSLCFPGIDNICFLDDLIVFLFTVVRHF